MDWKKQITEMITDYIGHHIEESGTLMRWKTPLVGFADANAPAFSELKEIVHSEHALPQDLLPEASIVVSYFLPFPEEIALTNLPLGPFASSEWAMAYRETNHLFVVLNAHMAAELARLDQNGNLAAETGLPPVKAVPPLKAATMDYDALTSRWSQRHVARIAGLGTFGVNNMLITEKGCCGRYSSFITNLKAPFDHPLEEDLCLFKRNGTCGLCIKRCSSGALTASGFNRNTCMEICEENQKFHDPDMIFNGTSGVCGKCLINLPCTFRRP